jgi:phenylacetate-CoA ligase
MLDLFRFAFDMARLRSVGHWDRDRIAALQDRRVRRLLAYAVKWSPFYRERLRGIDLEQCRLSELPTLSKAEMMDRFDHIVTDRRIRRADVERFAEDSGNLPRKYLGLYAVCHTSGSQGQPAIVVQEMHHVFRGIEAQAARGGDFPGVFSLFPGRVGKPMRFAVVTQRPGFYPTGAVFSHVNQVHMPLVRFLHLSLFDPIDRLVDRLNEFQPEFLTSYSSVLFSLAREQQAGRLRLREAGCLREIVNTSEALPDETREFIEDTFGRHVSNLYSMAECMALTHGCPERGGSHLNADLAVLEVVDEENRPVPEGEEGKKILVTNLYNRVQPLIRYEVRDVVSFSPSPCRCGSPFPLIRPVTGRSEDRFWIEQRGSYREIPYFLFLSALDRSVGLAEHQVVQTDRNEFTIRIAPLPGRSIAVEQIDRFIREGVAAEDLADTLKWNVEVVPEIKPDPQSGKIQRVKSLVGPPEGVGGTRDMARAHV